MDKKNVFFDIEVKKKTDKTIFYRAWAYSWPRAAKDS